MKILPTHLAHIRAAMAPLTCKAIAHRETLKTDPRVGDLEKRLRWDWLYAAVPSKWVCETIYPYADDTHLDTALRRIVGELLADPSLPASLS